MGLSDFWQDTVRATRISQEASWLKEEVGSWQNLKQNVDQLVEFTAEAEVEEEDHGDEDMAREIEEQYQKLHALYQKLEFAILFSGKYDSRPAILAIHAGTGGVDAMDWAEMLLRMYLRYFERQGFSSKILDEQRGREAGIKSVTLEVTGRYVYGYLKGEAGTHRLVRISPFDGEAMRHTSFALVEVLPDLGELAEVDIKEEDLRIDVFRSSGPGGQSVNTTDSAVRIVHLPTKISVSCQSERSQHQNKERALQILRAKLQTLEDSKQAETKRELRGEYHEAKWGSQIRSYVLQPYQLVKDHRTNYETSQVQDVLDGDLSAFIEAYLKKQKK
ncbi:MAG: Peptide chain release factor RF-2 [Parcubacteria group bacterium GW2011_GWC2_44_22]|nr:MAG: Peptide chain release factor RF-2 [Parcubacteria group bacterium GW2011_GWC2_44_22]